MTRMPAFGILALKAAVGRAFSIFFALCLGCLVLSQLAQAQIRAQTPAGKDLFGEDTSSVKKSKEAVVDLAIGADKPAADDLDVKAPHMQFDQESKDLVASGGVLISKQGATIQADSATVNLDTKSALLDGNIVFYYPGGVLTAESATLDIETETGEFEGASAMLERGFYNVRADQLNKVGEFDYKLKDAEFTTCNCPDGSKPWLIGCSDADAEQEGYAYARGAYLQMFGVPLLYSPYFIFPLKIERQTGLLAPTFGNSSENGAAFSVPLFVVLDGSSDMTLTPFVETKTRVGSSLDYRQVFSKESDLRGRVIYSDESARGDSLRGTNTQGLYDPNFKKDRVAGYYAQIWRTEPEAQVPLGFIADGHYVPDSLFLREIEDPDIGLRDERYTTSRAVFQAMPTEDIYSELSSEYNQALIEDPDLVFQRLPELSVSAQRSLRPFGYNPYGLKVVPGIDVLATNFSRGTGFEGTRADVAPAIKIPYHYQNYFNAQTAATLHQTAYGTQDKVWPGDPERIISQDQRTVPRIDQSVSTGVERVYHLSEDSWLTQMAALGQDNQGTRLRRIKHTIEPFTSYTYVPDRDQDGLPLYDTLDRIRQRSLFSYGVKTSAVGRFVPVNTGGEDISELTPELEDLPVLETEMPLTDFGVPGGFNMLSRNTGIRQGEIRDLVTLALWQSYDAIEARQDLDPDRSEWSDVGFGFGVAPTKTFTLTYDGNYGLERGQFSSWGLGGNLSDDRGDAIKTRYTFIEGTISQIETGLEVVLSERLRLGYYGRYDVRERDFIRNMGALRIYSACKCWHMDIGFANTLNPDNKDVMLRFTFQGLGDVTQRMGYADTNNGGV